MIPKVEIGGESYRVVGTFSHKRNVGETGEYAAIVPLNAAKTAGWTTMMISAKPIPESGALERCLNPPFRARGAKAAAR